MLEEDTTSKTQEDSANNNEDGENRLLEPLIYAIDEDADLSQIMELFFDTEHIFQAKRTFELLGNIENTLLVGDTTFRKFVGKGLSFAIYSFQEFIDELLENEVDIGEADALLHNIKKNFLCGMYNEAKGDLLKLNDIAPLLKNNYKQKLIGIIGDIELGIRDSKKIGANLYETERLLIDAKAFFENDILFDCRESLAEAKKELNEARSHRITLIKDAVGFVERMIADAKSIGANIQNAEEQLDQAKSQFIDEDFHTCIHSTIHAEEVTCELIQDQLKKALDLQKSLDERYKAVTTSSYNKQFTSIDLIDIANVDPYKIPCRICGETMEYVDRYRTWFCDKCQKYI